MNNLEKCIAIVTPSLEQGGMERVITEIANYSVSHNHKVYIICLITKQNQAYDLDERIEIISLELSYSRDMLFKFQVLRNLIKLLKTIKVDTVLSFSEVFNPLAIIASKVAKVPVYISDRSSPNRRHSKFKFIVRKATYPFASGMIAQTDLARSSAIKNKFNSQIKVIPNPLRDIHNYPSTKPKKVIISVGRLIKSKNFEELISIFSSIGKSDWELWIVGEGPDRRILEEHVARQALKDNIRLFGSTTNVDILFAQSSIFAFTSISEGFPNALSEAMAYPLACIAYDCPSGPSDLIRNGVNGFLIPINDSIKFRQNLNRLMESPELREKFKKEAIKNRFRYSKEAIIEEYLKFVFYGEK